MYAFDTDFVCYLREWDAVRADDRGFLLEHLVLNELLARVPRERVFFWRDKQGHEVDFLVRLARGAGLLAVECKAESGKFSPAGLRAFRGRHPRGTNIIVCLDRTEPQDERVDGMAVRFVPLERLDEALRKLGLGD